MFPFRCSARFIPQPSLPRAIRDAALALVETSRSRQASLGEINDREISDREIDDGEINDRGSVVIS